MYKRIEITSFASILECRIKSRLDWPLNVIFRWCLKWFFDLETCTIMPNWVHFNWTLIWTVIQNKVLSANSSEQQWHVHGSWCRWWSFGSIHIIILWFSWFEVLRWIVVSIEAQISSKWLSILQDDDFLCVIFFNSNVYKIKIYK